jgi:D-alanine-D-alanine ligase
MRQLKSALVFGGSSEERWVSVASAQNLCRHFPFAEIVFFNQAYQGYRVSVDELQAHSSPFTQAFVPQKTQPDFTSFAAALNVLDDKILFMGFHGSEGENGELQKVLEDKQISFTGSGSLASRLCFSKDAAKKVATKENVQIADELFLPAGQTAQLLSRVEEFLRANKKIVLKPNANGSSIGLYIVSSQEQLNAAWQGLLESKQDYVVEEFISGRELTVGVLQTKLGLQALTASEVITEAGSHFDYEGKYLGRGTREITPADLPATLLKKAQDLALKVHRIFGCFGYSRTDMILRGEDLFFLETNTLPGLTKASFIPQQLAEAGISMQEFVTGQLELASERDL